MDDQRARRAYEAWADARNASGSVEDPWEFLDPWQRRPWFAVAEELS
jgi:hypothetical protein